MFDILSYKKNGEAGLCGWKVVINNFLLEISAYAQTMYIYILTKYWPL